MGFTLRPIICPEIQNLGAKNGELMESLSNLCRQLAELVLCNISNLYLTTYIYKSATKYREAQLQDDNAMGAAPAIASMQSPILAKALLASGLSRVCLNHVLVTSSQMTVIFTCQVAILTIFFRKVAHSLTPFHRRILVNAATQAKQLFPTTFQNTTLGKFQLKLTQEQAKMLAFGASRKEEEEEEKGLLSAVPVGEEDDEVDEGQRPFPLIQIF